MSQGGLAAGFTARHRKRITGLPQAKTAFDVGHFRIDHRKSIAITVKRGATVPKHLAVLNAVAARIGWDKKPAKGVFRGLSQTMGFGSYVAACAEVSVDKAGVGSARPWTGGGNATNPG